MVAYIIIKISLRFGFIRSQLNFKCTADLQHSDTDLQVHAAAQTVSSVSQGITIYRIPTTLPLTLGRLEAGASLYFKHHKMYPLRSLSA